MLPIKMATAGGYTFSDAANGSGCALVDVPWVLPSSILTISDIDMDIYLYYIPSKVIYIDLHMLDVFDFTRLYMDDIVEFPQ